MVKASKLFTLDMEIVQKLEKEGNQSHLVNRLLKDYFNYLDSDDLDYLEAVKQEKSNKREIIDKELEHITDKILIVKSKQEKVERKDLYQTELKKIGDKSKALTDSWKQETINDKDYWEQMTIIQKEKEDILNKIRNG